MLDPAKIDVIILCGGKGKRLKKIVKDWPKPMSVFSGKPFLTHLMVYVAGFGFRRFILSTGYRGHTIEKYYQQHPASWQIEFCRETKALGTGGAVWHAKPWISSRGFLVLNGDSFLRVGLAKFFKFHLVKKALLSLVLVRCCGKVDSGKVLLGSRQRIIGFEEKASYKPNHFDNAGIYLMDRSVFNHMRRKESFSLEYDFFPFFLKERCFGFVQKGRLLDFGTPDRYVYAKRHWAKGLV